MCSFASRDPANISSTIQHNSKTNNCVCVFERERQKGTRKRERKREREREEGGERGRNLLYHMSAIVVAAPLLLV